MVRWVAVGQKVSERSKNLEVVRWVIAGQKVSRQVKEPRGGKMGHCGTKVL